VAEVETLTNTAHPGWTLKSFDPERMQHLSNTDRLLSQLHATNCELCHCRTVMTYALKFGKFALATLAAVEKHRLDLGLRPIPARHRSGLQESVDAMVVRCDSVSDRLAELKERLTGQINVVSNSRFLHCIFPFPSTANRPSWQSYNLIAQKDSKVNLMVAKLQSHDSRTMKGIAVLGLFFLPSTLIAVCSFKIPSFCFHVNKWHRYLLPHFRRCGLPTYFNLTATQTGRCLLWCHCCSRSWSCSAGDSIFDGPKSDRRSTGLSGRPLTLVISPRRN